MAKNSSQFSSSDHFQKSLKIGYEVGNENARGIMGIGILALIIGFGVFITCWWLFNHFKNEVFKERVPSSAFINENQIPPAPRLQLNPKLDLEKMIEKNHKRLNTFAWIPEAKPEDWVHIPIEDAMNLIVEEEIGKGVRKK